MHLILNARSFSHRYQKKEHLIFYFSSARNTDIVMATMLYLSRRDAKTLLHLYTSTWKKHPRLFYMALDAVFRNTGRTWRQGSSRIISFIMIIFMVLPTNVLNRSVVTSCLVFANKFFDLRTVQCLHQED